MNMIVQDQDPSDPCHHEILRSIAAVLPPGPTVPALLLLLWMEMDHAAPCVPPVDYW